MAIRTSGSGCGGFLVGWSILLGILTLLAGWGRWNLLPPGFWIFVPIAILAVGLVAWLAN